MAKSGAARKSAAKKTSRSKVAANNRAQRASERTFMIEHREEWHDHFDLRLECDGVLKSWAVPNGPPDGEAARSRLAVRMDDAPLLESKENALWDSGTWKPATDPALGFAKGQLSFALHGDRIDGDFSLIRLRSDTGRKQGKENWLLTAKRG